MHLEDAHILAYLDGELAEEEAAIAADHIESCETCSVACARLKAEREHASAALGILADAAASEPVDVASAQEAATRRSESSAQRREPGSRMLPKQSFVGRFGWTRIAATAAAILVAGSFAFAPVRTFAANILQVFRIQEIQTVSFTQADLEELQSALQGTEGHFDLDDLGEIWIEGDATAREVTLEEAQAELDFEVVVPEGLGEPTLVLSSEETWRLKLDVESFNELLESFGGTHLLPAEMDGEIFEITIPAVLTADYYDESADPNEPTTYTMVGQTRGPELVVPEGVNPLELRDVVLNMPLLPEHLRVQLAAIEDWRSTLVIPSLNGAATDIEVAGRSAVLLDNGAVADRAGMTSETGVIWNDEGVIRAVGGTMTEEQAISLAESMMR